MPLIQMSPKKWFWSILAAAFCWSIASWRWSGDVEHPGALRSTQNIVGFPLSTALVPPKIIFTSMQETVFGVLRRASPTGENPGTLDDLRDQITGYKTENTQLKEMLTAANGRLLAYQQMQSIGIQPDDTLVATVLGYEAGPGASVLDLDKGTMHGVNSGDPVVVTLPRSPGESPDPNVGDRLQNMLRVCLIGRVVSSNSLISKVRLLSDPGVTVHAQIIRPQLQRNPNGPGPFANDAVTSVPCLLIGMGAGEMKIEDINVQSAQPVKGDLVCLTDADWWSKTQYMVVGKIDSVARKENQPLRYNITVSPMVPVMTRRTVMIITKE